MKIFFSFTVLLLVFCARSSGQNGNSLEGLIVNKDAEPVEHAQVHLLNTSFTTYSDSSGEFSFSEVPDGIYILTIQKPGFLPIYKEFPISDNIEMIPISLKSGINRLQPVMVTAQKREEIVQEMPLSISSLSYQAVKEGHIQNTSDLTAIAPNLYTSEPGDRRTVTSIRGIVSTSYDPAVATYIDGVNQFNLDTYISQLYDIKRIEVLRGPQGTLYGRNAMGGVINIITREPGSETSFFAEATVANYGHQRFLAGVRTPLLENKLFFGAAGLYEAAEGFYYNEFDDSHYDEQFNFSGNYYLKFIFNERWKGSLNFKHFTNENKGAFPLVMGIEEALQNPFRLNQNEISKMIDNTINTSFVLDFKGDDLNFSSHTSYQKNYRYYEGPIDADFSPLDAISIFNNYGKDWNNTRVFTQEIRFSSPGGGTAGLNWTAGSFLFHQESPTRQATRFGEDAHMLGMEEKNFSLINTSEVVTKGAALFGQVNYALIESLNLIAGLRYDYEIKEQRVLGEYQRFSDTEPAFEFQQDTTAQADFTAISPKLGFSYGLAEENLVFLTYSRGFRAGGFTPLTSDPAQLPLVAYEPEFSNNFELGSKNSFFEGKLLLNTTLFYTDVRNVQVPTLVLPDAVVITRNTGELKSKGVEFELQALLFPGLKLSYDFGYTDATYNFLTIADEGQEEDLRGNKQVFTPETTSMLSTQFRRSFGKEETYHFFVRGEWKYLGKQYFDLANTLSQEPYNLYNGQFGFSSDTWKITFWGQNILDKRYVSYGYNFGAVHLGDPATYGITLSLDL